MSASQDISVRVLDAGHRAEIHIPTGIDPAVLSVSLLRVITHNAGVQVTAAVEALLEEVVKGYKASPQNLRADIARATSPVKGADGGWVWEPGFDPAAPIVTVSDASEGTDHHASRIVSIATGGCIARVTAPAAGVDGRTVTGTVLSALPGRANSLKLGAGLQLTPDGSVVATRDGVVRVSSGTVTVLPVLEIKGCVDFSTGKIDFAGDVVIADAVRDGFDVSATGDITVHGPVEGVDIVCGGNFICPRGVASAKRAMITVSGNATVGYLRNVTAVFKGDLECRAELEGSDITVHGMLRCETGRVIGGSLVLMGVAKVGTFGSPEWTPTVFCVGDLPRIAVELRKLGGEAARIGKLVETKEGILRLLRAGGGKGASAREQLTEVQYEVSVLRTEANQIDARRAELQEAVRQCRGVELHVARVLYPRVRVQCAETAYEFEKELRGPLQFLIDERGDVLIRIAAQPPQPITDFARSIASALPAVAPEPMRKVA